MVNSISEELARFAQLRDNGVLSEQEFQVQKAALLGGADADQQSKAVSRKKVLGGFGCATLFLMIFIVALFVVVLII